jgi:MFS family permease
MSAITPNDQFIEKNLKHNLTVNLLDGATFWFGYSFFSPIIILPLFLTHFTHNPILLGLIPFINTAGYLIPQLFSSNWVQHSPIKKFFPYNLGFFLERLPIALMVPVTLIFAKSSSNLTIIFILLLFGWHTTGAGTILVGWQDMIAKVIPTDKRGRFFGLTNFLGNIGGLLGALAVTQVLGLFPFPTGFVLAFATGASLNFLSWFFLGLTREPPDALPETAVSMADYFKSLPQVIRDNPNFRQYILSQVVITISNMANGFIIVYAVQNWNLPDSLAAGFTIAMLAGQIVANPLLGWLADRKGHKIVLEISLIINLVSLVLAIFAPSPLWFYLIFFLKGANGAGTFLSGTSITMEFSSAEQRPTFIGLANTIPGIAGALAPILGGWLAVGTGYPILFGVSSAIGLSGLFLMMLTVREPRKASA